MFLISLTSFAQTPEFEVYTGVVNPKKVSGLGYMVGLNVTPNLFQLEKGKGNGYRQWLNKMLFGFEFSGYSSQPQRIEVKDEIGEPITTKIEGCDCEQTTFGYFTRGGVYDIKQDVKGFTLNFGIEVYKGWYITSGVTAYKRQLLANGEVFDESRPIYLDAGVKKFFKIKKVFISPMAKFNGQTASFGVGFSYD